MGMSLTAPEHFLSQGICCSLFKEEGTEAALSHLPPFPKVLILWLHSGEEPPGGEDRKGALRKRGDGAGTSGRDTRRAQQWPAKCGLGRSYPELSTAWELEIGPYLRGTSWSAYLTATVYGPSVAGV